MDGYVMSHRKLNLRKVNLNLIPVLAALLREASVVRAAAALHLSPSATSCALAELRDLLDDPLLVRAGRIMRLTPRAQQLGGKLELAYVALEDLLKEQSFDPLTARRTFVIAALDYLSLLLGQDLVERLRAMAPHVRVRFVDVPADLEQRLLAGSIDLAIVAMNQLDWSGVSTITHCHDRIVGLVRANHPLARRKRPSKADIERYPFVGWQPGLDLSTRASRIQRPNALFRYQHQLTFQSLSILPTLILDGDMVTCVPSALARFMARNLPLHYFDLPFEKLEVESSALWSAAQEMDPAHQWFRELITESLIKAHSSAPAAKKAKAS